MTVATDLNPTLSLGALVAEQPERARLFEQLRLDYCCGGRQSLAEACAKRGLDLDDVQAALRALDTPRPDTTSRAPTGGRSGSESSASTSSRCTTTARARRSRGSLAC